MGVLGGLVGVQRVKGHDGKGWWGPREILGGSWGALEKDTFCFVRGDFVIVLMIY